MKILITGGAGYVGTRLSNYLYMRGHDVRVLDTLIYGNQGLYKNIQIMCGDIRDAVACERAVKDTDVVYHLAAISNDPTGDLDPQLTRHVNFHGTRTMLEAAVQSTVKRFIFASSSSVLGIQEGENVTEETTPNPLTPYSTTKLEAEQSVQNYAGKQLTTVAIRPATICGPSPRQRFDLAVNALTASAFFDEKITVYGGDQKRPITTISDMIYLYEHLLTVPDELINGEVFNAGWENKTILQIAEMIQKEVKTRDGGRPEIKIKPTVDLRDYHITSQKVSRILNWYPGSTSVDMVRELVQQMELGYISDPSKDIYHNIKMLTKKDK